MCLSPVFLHPLHLAKRGIKTSLPCPVMVGCGRCVECKIKRSREWSYRLTQEASLYDKNCMITLTYDDEHLPDDTAVHYEDFQKFMKRLRTHYKRNYDVEKVRFFASAEYGDRNGRPHFHAILFGVDFDDRYFFKYDNRGNALFRSPTLETLWKFGYSGITDFTQDSAMYVASYLQKVIDGKSAPCVHMSNRPGIGFDVALEKAESYIYSNKIYLNGKYIALPRYYKKIYERYDVFPDKVEAIKIRGLKTARKLYYEFGQNGENESLKLRRKKFERIFGKSLDRRNMI